MGVTSSEWLAQLVAFPSVSSRSNRDIATFIAARLAALGVAAELLWSGDKANLFATIGPAEGAGVILSGHMDVVPVEGQSWSSDPFHLAERDGRLHGRGAADMKGFLACVLSLVERMPRKALATPLHLCFSHDEEIGCVGVRPMLDNLRGRGLKPRFCVVGEPTCMQVMTGHKGKLAARATCHGVAGHSAMALRALNAINLAADFVAVLRRRQEQLRESGAHDAAYDIPYTTVHAGLIAGGTALNIVPDRCTVDFEIRTIEQDDAELLLAGLAAEAEALASEARPAFPEARIVLEVVNSYPGLDMPEGSEIVTLMGELVGNASTGKVAFGTEGGLFARHLGVPTVICGPGSMEQGHKPDEFVTRAQLDRCDAMLDRLVARLTL